MRGSSRQERLVAGIVLLTPLVIVCAFWRLRSVNFPRYDWIMREDRFLESSQFGFYLAAGLVVLWVSINFFKARVRGLGILFLCCCGACLFVAMEEISWGQRILAVSSSDYFLLKNSQGETNVHNLVVFQPYLHRAYILVAGILTALCLLPGGRLRMRFWFLIPRRRLVFYFLPVFVFYSWFELYRSATGRLIYAYDQELCEAVFAPGLFLFSLQILMEQKTRRTQTDFGRRTSS